MRSPGAYDRPPGEDRIEVNGIEYAKGQKVRIKPNFHGSDAADMLLSDKTATIEAIFVDYDEKIYLAVTVDEDPAQEMQRELGRYLYFAPQEVELLER